MVHIYRHGSEAFLSGQPLYQVEVAMGYLYAPAFAVLYVPLLKLGPYLGNVLWHMLGFVALTFAAMRQVRKVGGEEQTWLLSFGLFLALPVSLAALRNGQATILLTGACWFLTLSALEGRRAECFFWAMLAIVAKPTAIIMLLLAGALRPRLIPVLALAVIVVLVIPYGFASAGYINAQYYDFFRMLTSMTVDPTGPFVPADFTAPFTRFGMTLPEFDATIARVVAGLLTLWMVLQFDRRLDPNVSGTGHLPHRGVLHVRLQSTGRAEHLCLGRGAGRPVHCFAVAGEGSRDHAMVAGCAPLRHRTDQCR
ncbi:glycosyltransferase family 87 protein [Mesorhizobium atlanticum]